MTAWPDLQAAVAGALRQPEEAPPASVSKLQGDVTATKRFNVYRNNVALSLITVLGDTYPTIKDLTGEQFFSTMARHYINEHLPENPVMLLYGAEFAGFVKTYQPAAGLPYLSDLAALEWARNTAYHGADAEPLAITVLADYQEKDIPNLRFAMHPTLSLIISNWPVVSIWHAHQQDDTEAALQSLPEEGEAALITRPYLDVLVHPLNSGSLEFARVLSEGAAFGAAVEAAVKLDPDFDIPANLAGIFNVGAVKAVSLHSRGT